MERESAVTDMNLPFLPYGKQTIEDEDIAAVVEGLRHDYLTTGPAVDAFEAALAEAVGARYAVAVANGTAALHVACMAAEIGPGDEAVVSSVTFMASANCVRYCGGEPVFADIDPGTGLTTAARMAEKVSDRTRLLIPVHLTGRSVDMAAVGALAKERGLRVIEDAAHALGGRYRGRPVGCCEHSDMAIFSFHPVKHVTTGEGGAIVTNDEGLYERMRVYRNHGIVREPERFEYESPGPWYHEMQELGYNYRLTDVQCRLGLSQMRRLGAFVERRQAIAARYDAGFAGMARCRPLLATAETESAYHLYVVLIDFEALGTDRAAFVEGLRQRRIGTQVHYIPVPNQPYYQRRGHRPEDVPGAQDYYGRALSLPMYPAMSDADVDRVIDAVRSLCAEAGRG